MPDFPKVEEHWQALCDRFNAGGYWQRAQEGQYIREIKDGYDREVPDPDPILVGPPGTRSRMEKWLDRDGSLVAIVHLYLCPDGSAGGKTKRPKPKVLIENGVHYFCHSQYRRDST